MSEAQNQPAGRPKPGAMTMAMRAVQAPSESGPKVLRIGMIRDGKIVEERVIRQRETVSVGSSEKNHFIVHAEGVPQRFELFQLVGNSYILNFTKDMKGRVALPGGVSELDQLRESGGARDAGSHFQVKLNESSRGKVVVGNTTLLFQFVSPPPIQPRPQLPAAARGGFVKTIDWMFTAFVVFTYMIFFGFVVYLESADWPIDQGIAAVPENLSKFIFEEPPPPEPEQPEEEVVNEEAEAEEEAVAEAPEPSSQPREAASNSAGNAEAAAEAAAARAEATARIASEAAQQAESMILGALGEGGALENVLAGGAVTGNAAEVLAQAEGVGVASSQGGALRERSGGGGSGRAGSLGSLARAGGAGATAAAGEGAAVQERRVRGNVKMSGGDEIGGSGMFDQAQVSRMIKSRQSAIKRCYETALRNNPTLAGKVSVQFTIMERGNVSGARATENTTNDAGLASCVVRVVAGLRWRQGPEGGSVQYEYPFVFAPQN